MIPQIIVHLYLRWWFQTTRTRLYFICTTSAKNETEELLIFISSYVFCFKSKLRICNCCVVSSTLSIHKFLFVFICLNHFSWTTLMKDKNSNNVFPLNIYTFHDKYDSQRNSPKAITHMKCEFFWRTVIYNNKNNNYSGQLMEVVCSYNR